MVERAETISKHWKIGHAAAGLRHSRVPFARDFQSHPNGIHSLSFIGASAYFSIPRRHE
jgi:hypothetical protein